MVKSAKWAMVVLTALTFALVLGCAKVKTMSDAEFTKVTGEWLTEYLGVAMQKVFSGVEVTDKEMEKLAYETLDKVCKNMAIPELNSRKRQRGQARSWKVY